MLDVHLTWYCSIIIFDFMVKALRVWLDYKYRDRKIVRKNGDNIQIDNYEKPEDIGDS